MIRCHASVNYLCTPTGPNSRDRNALSRCCLRQRRPCSDLLRHSGQHSHVLTVASVRPRLASIQLGSRAWLATCAL